eukprot:9786722-Alexandrium_andersonii.AAC.1
MTPWGVKGASCSKIAFNANPFQPLSSGQSMQPWGSPQAPTSWRCAACNTWHMNMTKKECRACGAERMPVQPRLGKPRKPTASWQD